MAPAGAILLAVVATSGASGAAAPDCPSEPATCEAAWKSHHGWRQIAFDARYIVSRPAHMGAKGWWKVAATVGTAGLLYVVRDDIQEWSREHRCEDRDRILQDARTSAKGLFIPVLSLSFYLASFGADRDRERETAVMLLESMGYSAAFAGIGQYVLASERPSEGDEVEFFATGGHGISVDAAIAASMSAPLHGQYLVPEPGDSRAVRFWKGAGSVVVYGIPVLVAWQRVNADAHYAPDAFLGVVTGFTFGQMVVDAHQVARGSPRRLSPFFGDRTVGVAITW